MGDSTSSNTLYHPVDHYSILVMLYYGFFVVGTAALILALYHCFVIKCSANANSASWAGPEGGSGSTHDPKVAQLAQTTSTTTFKYEKGKEGDECVVCLSIFEDGEDIRELSKCKHSFHTPCIDTWLSSRLECPLCRTPVVAARTEISLGMFSGFGV